MRVLMFIMGNISDFDLKVLSLGWPDWILIAEIEQRFREAGSRDSWEDTITWVRKFADLGYLTAGDYSDGAYRRWSEAGSNLEAKIRAWMAPNPQDPLGPSMTLMMELTDAGKADIPSGEHF